MSARLFPHRATVRRDVPVGTNGRTQMTDLHTDLRCIFIPLASRAEIDNGYDVGTGADVYFQSSDADVKTGDQLIWDGDTYNVRAARPIKIARVGHTHVLATREGK